MCHWHQTQVRILQTDPEETIHSDVCRTDVRREEFSQRRNTPIPYFKLDCFPESAPRLIIEASRAQYIRHLNQGVPARFYDPADFLHRLSGVFSAKVLQHAVRKHMLEPGSLERKKSGVSYYIFDLKPELPGHA